MNNRLVITPVDETGLIPSGAPFVAMINPSSLSFSHKVEYNHNDVSGTVVSKKSFSHEHCPEVSFDLIIDGTGATEITPGTPLDVEGQVELFKRACYYYVGTDHRPPYVQITWWAPLLRYNEKLFSGVIESFNVVYTLFSPTGLPLRAKISAKFIGSMDAILEEKVKDKSSPDLTHNKTINEGTSLSALCKEVYGDESFILEVARLNNLVSFRNIKPGTKLIFPPIK